VTGRPCTSILAHARQFLKPEVFDHIPHRDSSERMYLIGIDGQSPTSHCPLCGGFRFELVKGANLPFLANALSRRQNMVPAEHPNRGPAAISVDIERAVLLPRLPHEFLLPLRAQNASVIPLYC
jgi:hypothetical protein